MKEWKNDTDPALPEYLRDLLDDWATMKSTEPSLIVKISRDLSVGPIRTISEGTIPIEEAFTLTHSQLGEWNCIEQLQSWNKKST